MLTDLNGDGVQESLYQEVKGFLQKRYQAGKDLLTLAKTVAVREGQETAEAAVIVAHILQRGHATETEIKFLKHQSVDILKILGLLGISAVSTVIPIFLDKVLRPKGINIFPTEMDQQKKEITSHAD